MDQRPSVLMSTPTQRPTWAAREPVREPVRNVSAVAATRKKHVLIVDDNETVLEILEEFLGGGYEVHCASNAESALTALGAQAPDAILLDLNMPGMDGISFLEALRTRGINMPVIMMTGYDEPGMAQRAKDSGATAYLVKPVDLRQLDHLLATTLRVPPLVSK